VVNDGYDAGRGFVSLTFDIDQFPCLFELNRSDTLTVRECVVHPLQCLFQSRVVILTVNHCAEHDQDERRDHAAFHPPHYTPVPNRDELVAAGNSGGEALKDASPPFVLDSLIHRSFA
jgi:hypothetical protein